MKRTLLVLVALLLLPAASAEAKTTKNDQPRIHIGRIVESATEPGSYVIPLDAVDPDGFITELALDFGDGVVLQMLLFCDPATGPGDPVHQEITWSYPPGKYKLRAQAYSTPGCFEGDYQDSKIDSARLRVR